MPENSPYFSPIQYATDSIKEELRLPEEPLAETSLPLASPHQGEGEPEESPLVTEDFATSGDDSFREGDAVEVFEPFPLPTGPLAPSTDPLPLEEPEEEAFEELLIERPSLSEESLEGMELPEQPSEVEEFRPLAPLKLTEADYSEPGWFDFQRPTPSPEEKLEITQPPKEESFDEISLRDFHEESLAEPDESPSRFDHSSPSEDQFRFTEIPQESPRDLEPGDLFLPEDSADRGVEPIGLGPELSPEGAMVEWGGDLPPNFQPPKVQWSEAFGGVPDPIPPASLPELPGYSSQEQERIQREMATKSLIERDSMYRSMGLD